MSLNVKPLLINVYRRQVLTSGGLQALMSFFKMILALLAMPAFWLSVDALFAAPEAAAQADTLPQLSPVAEDAELTPADMPFGTLPLNAVSQGLVTPTVQ